MEQYILAFIAAGSMTALINVIYDAYKRWRDKKEKKNESAKAFEELKKELEELKTEQREQRARQEEMDKKFDLLVESYLESNKVAIKANCNEMVKRGYTTSEELEDIISMHKAYHNLGGNGYCDTVINKVTALPIK